VRKTILVVDDDVDARDVLRLALEDEGYVVESANNGLSALHKLRSTKPHLIILDLNMPRMGGEEFLYAWRAHVQTSGVPVIILTAASDALTPDDLGVEAFFSKPFELNTLLWHINDLLALPNRSPAWAGGDARGTEVADLTERLATIMSAVLISAEQLCAAQELPDDLQNLAAIGLGAAQRASVLVRRLNHLMAPRP